MKFTYIYRFQSVENDTTKLPSKDKGFDVWMNRTSPSSVIRFIAIGPKRVRSISVTIFVVMED